MVVMPMNDMSQAEAKANACAYILHMLLQRLEARQPGLVQDMLSGAKADQAVCTEQENKPEGALQVFDEAIAILERIHCQNQEADHPSRVR